MSGYLRLDVLPDGKGISQSRFEDNCASTCTYYVQLMV